MAIKVHLKDKHLAVVAVAALAASIGLGGLMFRLATGKEDVLVWCRNYVLATIDGSNFVGAAVSILMIIAAAASVLNAAGFLAMEGMRTLALRRHVAGRRLPISGRASAAASAVGADVAMVAFIADDEPAAFTFGLLSPKIVLTTGLQSALTQAGLKAVLAHELHHLRRRDPLRSFTWELLRRTFFFLPMLREVATFAASRREISADALAEKKAGRHALVSALLAIVGSGRQMASVAPFGHIRSRIAALAAPSAALAMEIPLPRLVMTVIVSVAILAANAAYGAPVSASDDTGPPSCETARMSQINFSPYLRIEIGRPMMTSAVQSPAIAP